MKEFSRFRPSSFGSFIVDRMGTILGFDQALERLTGWEAVDAVGRRKDLTPRVSTHETGTVPMTNLPLYEGVIRAEIGVRNQELALNCRDGRRLDAEAAVRRLDGSGDRTIVTILRVLASHTSRSVPQSLAHRDALTGLPDVVAFREQLSADFQAAASVARPLALVLLDIDHLREVNDRHGYAAGDELLRKLAGILRATIEDERRVARLGDDDFALLLPEAGRGEARQIAAALRSTVARYRFPFATVGRDVPAVTLSLGSASFPADADSETELFERALEARDEARAMGGNRVWCYLRRPRVPLEVPVFFDGADPLLIGYMRDLSPSGIFVQTSTPIEVGMRCALAFPLPGLQGKVHVIGRIVRMVPSVAQLDRAEPRVPGIGVEFERFGGSTDRRAIESFLHDQESQSKRPEIGRLSIN